MSNCTFMWIKGFEIKLFSAHYSTIKDIIKGYGHFEMCPKFDLSYSDTGVYPAFIIHEDNKEIYSTEFNGFIDLDDAGIQDSAYTEIKAR